MKDEKREKNARRGSHESISQENKELRYQTSRPCVQLGKQQPERNQCILHECVGMRLAQARKSIGPEQ